MTSIAAQKARRASPLGQLLARSLLIILAVVLAVQSAASRAEDRGSAGRTVYVSSSAGNDGWDGSTPDRPWRSLARVNQAKFGPGDRILFKTGDVFAGQLVINSSGEVGRPLRIGSYASGAKPILDGGSARSAGFSSAILVRNQQHIEIADLEITNTVDRASGSDPADWSFGIYVINDGAGLLQHFRLERLTIRDVFAPRIDHSSEDAFNRVVVSAIRFAATTPPGGAASHFRDVVIADNLITRSGRFGVQIGQSSAGQNNQDADRRDPETGFNQDILIRDNRFVELGGSAVQLSGARRALIENNLFDRTGSSIVPDRMVGRGSGAWVINSRDIVAQRNRSLHVRGYKDSYGLHVDFGNRNILYQYNYSENSEGGFVEILGNNRNVIWRYNISVNDGLREKDGNTLWFSTWSPARTPSEGIFIYNNTVFIRSGLYPDLDLRARGAYIWNNIFYASREAMIGETSRTELFGGQLELGGNLFAGRINAQFKALDGGRVEADPQFVSPGALGPEGYRLQATSPARGSGITVRHPPFPTAGQGALAKISAEPTVDFFGNPLPRKGPVDIGAAAIR